MQRRALADDSAEVHRYLHFFAQIVALALELFAQSRVLLESGAQLALLAVALRDVLRRNHERHDGAGLIAIRGRRQLYLDDLARLGDVGARLVLQLAVRDHIHETAAAKRRLEFRSHEVRDELAQHLFTAIAELLEPTIAHVNDPPGRVDRVQHRGRRAIELAVALLDACLLPYLCVDDDRAQRIAVGAALDHRAREAVDAFSLLRPQIDGDAIEPTSTAQHREVFLGDAPRRVLAREIFRTNVRKVLA